MKSTKAEVPLVTFYAHYTDKYDLFTTAISQLMRPDLATGLDESTGFTKTNLRTLILISGNLMMKLKSVSCTVTVALHGQMPSSFAHGHYKKAKTIKRILSENYDAMTRFMTYLVETSPDYI